MSHPLVDALEPRALFSFVGLDASYGNGGVATPAKTGATTAYTYPTADGGAVVKVGASDLRRLDASGRLVKSFGGGDGVLTTVGNAALVAVDRASGRIAVLDAGAPVVRFYDANGTFEREGTSGTDGYNLRGARAMTFDNAGRLLVASEGSVTRILPTTGLADAAFGTNGVVTVPTESLPAGDPEPRFDAADEPLTPFPFLRLAVRPAGEADAGGELTFVRDYDTEGNGTHAAGTYLDVRRYGTDGQPAGVATIQTGFTRNNAQGGTESSVLILADASAAADGSLTLLAARVQSSRTALVSQPTFYENQLFRVTDTLGTPRDLDNALQIPPGTFNRDAVRLATTPDGTRAYVVGNNRVAAFDAVTLSPVASFDGAGGAAQLASRAEISDATVDARGRLLLSAGLRVRAVDGVVDSFGTKSGVATLLADGTLDVSGTGKRDRVTIGYASKKRIVVTINGHAQFFARADVRGTVVHTGKGDDVIDASALLADRGVYVQPGSGNDRVLGGAGNDTIDGADGHDSITGNAGDDLAFGATDDDTIRSAQRGDALFTTDEDPLFA